MVPVVFQFALRFIRRGEGTPPYGILISMPMDENMVVVVIYGGVGAPRPTRHIHPNGLIGVK